MQRARDEAATRAVCPICFDDLASKAEEVGALVYNGRRVESALYHQSCVAAGTGRGASRVCPELGGVSPMTRKPVNGFVLMPPTTDPHRWGDFVDWNCDGALSISEVAVALAAILPVDEQGMEDFIRDQFNADRNGKICMAELEGRVLPYVKQFDVRAVRNRLLATLAPAGPPTIAAGSSSVDMVAWFRYWDSDGDGFLDRSELCYALVFAFYSVLGQGADAATADAILEGFLQEADLDGDGQVSLSEFRERLAPKLLVNLPAGYAGASDAYGAMRGPAGGRRSQPY